MRSALVFVEVEAQCGRLGAALPGVSSAGMLPKSGNTAAEDLSVEDGKGWCALAPDVWFLFSLHPQKWSRQKMHHLWVCHCCRAAQVILTASSEGTKSCGLVLTVHSFESMGGLRFSPLILDSSIKRDLSPLRGRWMLCSVCAAVLEWITAPHVWQQPRESSGITWNAEMRGAAGWSWQVRQPVLNENQEFFG